jgi:hypothetical protein
MFDSDNTDYTKLYIKRQEVLLLEQIKKTIDLDVKVTMLSGILEQIRNEYNELQNQLNMQIDISNQAANGLQDMMEKNKQFELKIENLKEKTNNKYVKLNYVFNPIISYEDNLLNFINNEMYKEDIFLNISIKNVIGIPEIKNIKDNFDKKNKNFEDLINILKNKEEKIFFDFDIFINLIDFIMLKDDKNLDIKFYKKIENNEIIDISSYIKNIKFFYENIELSDKPIIQEELYKNKDIILIICKIIKLLELKKEETYDTEMYNYLYKKIKDYLIKIIKNNNISKSKEFDIFQQIDYKNKKFKNNLLVILELINCRRFNT